MPPSVPPPPEILIPRRELARAALVLALALAAAYGNVVFADRSLVYSDNYNPLDTRLSDAAFGHGYDRPSTPLRPDVLPYANFHDPGGAWWQWEPGAVFLRRGLLRGEPPWWDPWTGAGAPAMANVMTTPFFPPYLAVVLLGDTPLLRTAYSLALLWAAGLFGFAFLRKHGLGFSAALLGAAAYVFSGAIAQNVGSFIGQTAACLPAALWLARRLLDRPSRGRTAALAAGFAAISLSSFPPVLVGIFGLTTLYVVWMALAERSAARTVLLRFAAGSVLGLGLVAAYYLPFAALARSAPHVAEAYGEGAWISLPFVCLFQLLSPTLMGGSKVYLDPPIADPYFLQLPYVGIAVLALAAVARRTGGAKSRALVGFLAAAAALVALKIFGVPPIHWLAAVPGLHAVHFAAYLGIPLDFLLAGLAAVGFEALSRGEVTRRRALVVAVCSAAVLLGLVKVAADRGVFHHLRSATWLREWAVVAVVGAIVTSALVWAARRTPGGPGGRAVPVAAAVVLAAFAAEALVNTAYPRQRRWGVWRRPVPYVQELRTASREGETGGPIGGRVNSLIGGRVFTAGAFPANAGSAFEVPTLDSLHTFNSIRVYRLYRRYVAPDTPFFLREATRLPPEGVLDRADLELLAIGESAGRLIEEAAARGYPVIYRDGYVRIFRRRGSPRYFFTSEFEVAQPLQTLRNLGKLPPGRRVLLDEEPSFPRADNREDDPAVVVEDFHPNGYRLAVEAPRAGLVYCSESSMPGWIARVDGRAVPIVAANYAFRAVEVPAGSHRVEMTYRPPGLTAGLTVTAVSAVLLLALALPRKKRNLLRLGS